MLPERKAFPRRETSVLFEFGFILKSRGHRRNLLVLGPLSGFITLLFICRCKLCSAETLLTRSFADTESCSNGDPEFRRDFVLGRTAAGAAWFGDFLPQGSIPPSPVTPEDFLGSFV